MMTTGQLEPLMIGWAEEAGVMARHHYRHTGDLSFKRGREAVTEVDRQIEVRLREQIGEAFPGDAIVGEELGGPDSRELGPTARVWHVDPIDGTLNYALGLPGFCTSLALMQGTEILAACVHQPISGDTFTAIRGGGARLNGETIKVSRRFKLRDAVISAQFRKDGLLVSDPPRLQSLFRQTMKVRKTGAIALELAWTAAGFMDGLLAGFRNTIQLYDVAAGLLLVTEAGGELSDFQGRSYQPGGCTLVATNGGLHDELIAFLNQA